VCTIKCDLRNPSAACGSNTCVWDGSLKETDCDTPGTNDLYDSCDSYNDCKPGLTCVAITVGVKECERWCRIGHDGDCGLFETCVDIYAGNGPTQGSDKLGACQ
jgi:hypothetical protein